MNELDTIAVGSFVEWARDQYINPVAQGLKKAYQDQKTNQSNLESNAPQKQVTQDSTGLKVTHANGHKIVSGESYGSGHILISTGRGGRGATVYGANPEVYKKLAELVLDLDHIEAKLGKGELDSILAALRELDPAIKKFNNLPDSFLGMDSGYLKTKQRIAFLKNQIEEKLWDLKPRRETAVQKIKKSEPFKVIKKSLDLVQSFAESDYNPIATGNLYLDSYTGLVSRGLRASSVSSLQRLRGFVESAGAVADWSERALTGDQKAWDGAKVTLNKTIFSEGFSIRMAGNSALMMLEDFKKNPTNFRFAVSVSSALTVSGMASANGLASEHATEIKGVMNGRIFYTEEDQKEFRTGVKTYARDGLLALSGGAGQVLQLANKVPAIAKTAAYVMEYGGSYVNGALNVAKSAPAVVRQGSVLIKDFGVRLVYNYVNLKVVKEENEISPVKIAILAATGLVTRGLFRRWVKGEGLFRPIFRRRSPLRTPTGSKPTIRNANSQGPGASGPKGSHPGPKPTGAGASESSGKTTSKNLIKTPESDSVTKVTRPEYLPELAQEMPVESHEVLKEKIVKELGAGGEAVVYELEDGRIYRQFNDYFITRENELASLEVNLAIHQAGLAFENRPLSRNPLTIGVDRYGEFRGYTMLFKRGEEFYGVVSRREVSLFQAAELERQLNGMLTVLHKDGFIHGALDNILVEIDENGSPIAHFIDYTATVNATLDWETEESINLTDNYEDVRPSYDKGRLKDSTALVAVQKGEMTRVHLLAKDMFQGEYKNEAGRDALPVIREEVRQFRQALARRNTNEMLASTQSVVSRLLNWRSPVRAKALETLQVMLPDLKEALATHPEHREFILGQLKVSLDWYGPDSDPNHYPIHWEFDDAGRHQYYDKASLKILAELVGELESLG